LLTFWQSRFADNSVSLIQNKDMGQQPFISLVNQILHDKYKDPNAATSALERQISWSMNSTISHRRRLRLWRGKMPINNFSGTTYVAFSDLNGFKEMMRNHEKAAKALDKLYKTVYALKVKPEYFQKIGQNA